MSSRGKRVAERSSHGACADCARISRDSYRNPRRPKYCINRKLNDQLNISIQEQQNWTDMVEDQCTYESPPGIPCTTKKKSQDLRCRFRTMNFFTPYEPSPCWFWNDIDKICKAPRCHTLQILGEDGKPYGYCSDRKLCIVVS